MRQSERPPFLPWPAILRPALVVSLAAMLAACATSAPSTAGSAASPSIEIPTASGSGAAAPLASPPDATASPADAVENVPVPDGVLNAIWIGDGTTVAGGFAGPMFTATILVFEDGVWSVGDTPDRPGQVSGITGFGDRFIAVGNGLPDIRSGYIWDSTDGRVWREIQTIEDAAIYDVVAGEGVIVAVGARLDGDMNATTTAWSSTDGATWKQATVGADGGNAMGSVTTTPDGFAATGDRPLGEARPFWTATAPNVWAARENDLSDQLLPSDLVHSGEEFALAGASGRSGDQHPFVALSTGGERWETTNLSGDEGYVGAVAVANERLVVVGVEADRLTLWSLNDAAWAAETIEPSGASVSALIWDMDRGLIGVGARDGRHAVWSFGDR